jgi:hypothetical protein
MQLTTNFLTPIGNAVLASSQYNKRYLRSKIYSICDEVIGDNILSNINGEIQTDITSNVDIVYQLLNVIHENIKRN